MYGACTGMKLLVRLIKAKNTLSFQSSKKVLGEGDIGSLVLMGTVAQ